MPDTNEPPWFSVTYLVRSTDTSPAAITASIALTPTSIKQRGERVSPSNPSSPLRTDNVWTLAASSLHVESLDDVLAALLEQVPARLILPADCSVELRIGLTARPMGNIVELGPSVMGRLAGLGAWEVLDVYDSEAE